jgi:hypothetical protein
LQEGPEGGRRWLCVHGVNPCLIWARKSEEELFLPPSKPLILISTVRF